MGTYILSLLLEKRADIDSKALVGIAEYAISLLGHSLEWNRHCLCLYYHMSKIAEDSVGDDQYFQVEEIKPKLPVVT